MKLLDTALQKRPPYKEVNLSAPTLNVGSGEGHFADPAINWKINVGLDVSHQLVARGALVSTSRTLMPIDRRLWPYSNAVAWDDVCTFHIAR